MMIAAAMVANLSTRHVIDWATTDIHSPSYIANKPGVTAYVQENSDWNSTTSPTEILNKPIIPASSGAQGPVGLAGPVGPQGPVGLTGAQGSAGIQGVIGNTGGVGPQGAVGSNGIITLPDLVWNYVTVINQGKASTASTGFSSAQYAIDAQGIVRCRGTILNYISGASNTANGGTATSTTPFMQLPSGYTPTSTKYVVGTYGNSSSYYQMTTTIQINTDGTVVLPTGPSAAVNLDNIIFSTV